MVKPYHASCVVTHNKLLLISIVHKFFESKEMSPCLSRRHLKPDVY